MSLFRTVLIFGLSLPFLFAFQNCGKGFVASHVENSASSLCKAQYKSDVVQQKWTSKDFRCDDFAAYACERRVFSPDVDNLSHTLTECAAGDRVCVEVETRQFSTRPAYVAQHDDADFLPGGVYNRDEIQCHHRWLYKGVAVFEGNSDTLEEALSQAMRACDQALAKSEQP